MFVSYFRGHKLANERSLLEYKARIQKVIDHVEKNIDGKLPLELLAEVSCFSPYHFHRIFHAFVGETPGEFVNRIRMERAASRLLTYPSEPITDIAYKCGFVSPSSFSRSFRDYFGCSASEWRGGKLDGLMNDKSRKADGRKWEAASASAGYANEENSGKTTGRAEKGLVSAGIRSMPAFRVAYIAHLDGYNEKIGRLFDRLRRWADTRGLLTDEAKFIGIAPDNPRVTPSDKRRYYACMTVPIDAAPDQGVGITDIPAAMCAVARFEGAQSEIAPAYDELFRRFIPDDGYQPADLPAYEIYYNDPQKSPGRIFTLDLCVPVESWRPCQG